MDQNNNNFMDSRTLWAILLVGVVWFGWQQYINKKYGSQSAPLALSKDNGTGNQQGANAVTSAPSTPTKATNVEAKAAEAPEQMTAFANENFQAQISSKGMALKKVQLAKFKNRDGAPEQFSGGEAGLYATLLGGRAVDFSISNQGQGVFIGEAHVSGIKVLKKISFTEGYNFNVETTFEANEGFLPPIQMVLEDDLKKVEAGSIFSPPTDTQEIFVRNQEDDHEFNLAHEKEGISATVKQAILTSVNGHYFSAAFLDGSEIMPDFSMDQKPSAPFLKGSLIYSVGADKKVFTAKGIGFIGPKDIKVLESVDPVFLKLVKFGFFSAIAKPLLITMKWINGILGNWGWSIILLTLLVRMVVMPLHIMSFRSMKAMQKVQPLIQSLRERYKDDPMTLNREMMELMKKHKVNPMGGCLPMLLQIPVFFALYRVFSESIELYQAPFIFWIHDLSIKDPFFVLPILMAAVMYLQQKMTPSTMDPAQAKVMQFMPLIFSFMMISLPSALTLYMFVSTFFGILQQYLFLRDKPSTVAVK
jgi:YidC/Oxa1 family membrane protein insertase